MNAELINSYWIKGKTECGAMDLRRLYESPFTDFNDQGVRGRFERG